MKTKTKPEIKTTKNAVESPLQGFASVAFKKKNPNDKYLTHAELKAQGFSFKHSYSWE